MTERRPLVLVSGAIKELPSGDTLPGGGGWTLLSSVATTSGTSVSFTSMPATYNDLLFEVVGVSHNSGSVQSMRAELSPDGSTWTSALSIGFSVANTGFFYGGLFLPSYLNEAGIATANWANLASDNSASVAGSTITWRISAGIQAVRFSPSAGSFDAGSINLYAR